MAEDGGDKRKKRLIMIIGVTGGKGGIGKSTVATSLALEFAKKGPVLLVDADVDCPNDHLVLGLKQKKLKSVVQRVPEIDKTMCTKCGKCIKACDRNALIMVKSPFLLADQCNGCGVCQFVCPTGAISWSQKEIGEIYNARKGNLRLLTGELVPMEPGSERVVQECVQLIGDEPTVIIDTAAGTHCPVITALEPCDLVLAVTEPTPLAIHDLGLITELLKLMNKRVKVVLNKAGISSMKVPFPVFARIPFDKSFEQQYSKGEGIVHPSIETLARRLR